MRRSMGILCVVASWTAGCGGKDGVTPPSNAGDLVITYFQGGPQAGAILFTITGGAVQSVAPKAGQAVQVSYAVPIAGTTRVLVTGQLVTGDLLTIRVADTTLATSYVARVDQVADNVTFSLLDPTGHTFTVHH